LELTVEQPFRSRELSPYLAEDEQLERRDGIPHLGREDGNPVGSNVAVVVPKETVVEPQQQN
jgi:hypothetical protein